MVTSPWNLLSAAIRGLVSTRSLPKLNCLIVRFQFRGEWSEWIANFTSESDSDTFCMLLCCFSCYFSTSLTMNLDNVSWKSGSQVPVAAVQAVEPCFMMVRASIFFGFWLILQSPFVYRLQWRKVTIAKCGSSFVYKYYGQFNFEIAFVFCRSVALFELYSFSDPKMISLASILYTSTGMSSSLAASELEPEEGSPAFQVWWRQIICIPGCNE